MLFSKEEMKKLYSIIESFRGGCSTFTEEEIELAKKTTFGDYIIQFGLSVDETTKLLNCIELCCRSHKAVGFRITAPIEESKSTKLTNNRIRQIIREEITRLMK